MSETPATSHLGALFCCVLLCLPKGTVQGPHEKRILNDLLKNYNVLERPVANESEPLVVSFGLTLQQIIDVEWNDVNLRWNASEYGGVQDLRIPPKNIWKPDVLMYNSADEKFDSTYPTNVVLKNNGSCLYVPPGIFKSTCKIDITWFPFDDQECKMKFGSWTYDGWQLDLILPSDEGDASNFIPNGEWTLLGVPGKRNEISYACCPQPYIDITYTILIRRRTLYYFSNLIVPCVLIASMAVLGFTLPPDSGEKLSLGIPGKRNELSYACCPQPYIDITYSVRIRRRTLYYLHNLVLPGILISTMVLLAFTLPPDSGEKLTLGVTVLLSLTVFLNQVAANMPETSEAVPLLGVTILLSLTVFLNMVAESMPTTSDAVPLIGTYFNCIMFMVASSVVSTVLILNYHHRSGETHEMAPWVRSVFLQWMPWLLRMSRPGEKITRKNIIMNNKMKELELKERSSKSLLANVLDMDDDYRGGLAPGPLTLAANSANYTRLPPGQSVDDLAAPGCLAGCARELQLILRELRTVTDRLRQDDEEAVVTSDWKFAAMVVDRLCLIVFTLFTVVATVAVLLSAPHIIVP
ncbi:acetylcholine receptor subunit alpha-type acr-16-like isoform X2 [Amphibalanus amphitrite]|uniref:acetylcholine receptor subunit alpha-type acr-16-like isoform X2 n=1 Tax=Amphibalanus amphitrite TaxID=1232801 RepID=UPI001C923019|nr:acetylcholine receptor subunit alpha-type acr-16-like isoform X2 [Amphibalanus amphitrite]